MEKTRRPFFDVFTELVVPTELNNLFLNVDVEKVVMNKICFRFIFVQED